ncbi:MAG: signal peptidase I [Gammaproteobacteria bacterium]|nr:signal peptidase I [Gammaproteobacteria bacterium]
MHFDFEFLLVLGTLGSGLIWLIDHFMFARQRQKEATSKSVHDPIIVEYSKSFFPVLLAVMILRSFVYEPFRIPSGSMMPTLLVGDFILVNKYDYGLRLPVIHTEITGGEKPKRGDIAVFRYPKDESLDYIKRVIGLPGDHISYYNRRLSVNGKLVKTQLLETYQGLGESSELVINQGCDNIKAKCKVFNEELGETSYTMMTNPDVRYSADGELFVPSGHYFVMGDNRDHSNDSRFWGFVPEENLVGKAVMIWMHWDWRNGGTGLELSRIGTRISD